MLVNLSTDEMASTKEDSIIHYPDCFHNLISYDRFFSWEVTRQGRDYWERKLEDLEWWYNGERTSVYNLRLKTNLTKSDKVYMAILLLASRYKVSKFNFSANSSKGIQI